MDNKHDQLSNSEIIDSLVNKCWEDDSFKQKLVDSPRSTIEEFLGRPAKLPTSSKFVINDQEASSSFYINIPPKPNLDVELVDSELELIAGGGNPACTINVGCNKMF